MREEADMVMGAEQARTKLALRKSLRLSSFMHRATAGRNWRALRRALLAAWPQVWQQQAQKLGGRFPIPQAHQAQAR